MYGLTCYFTLFLHFIIIVDFCCKVFHFDKLKMHVTGYAKFSINERALCVSDGYFQDDLKTPTKSICQNLP